MNTPSPARPRRWAAGGWAGLLWAGLCGTAPAAQPLAVQDAAVKPAGGCEWEAAAVHERVAGSPRVSGWSGQFGCGVGLDSEMAAALGRTRGAEPASVWAVAGKTALRPQAGEDAGVALAWSVMADKAPGVPPRAHGWEGGVALTSAPGGLAALLHFNAGLNHDRPTHRTRLSWGAAAERPLAPGWDLTAEAFGIGLEPPSAALGLRWTAGEQLVLGIARVRCLCSPGAGSATFTTTLAF